MGNISCKAALVIGWTPDLKWLIQALIAEGRLSSDMELTEQEMERMVIETSRAEFLAEEYGYQLRSEESSTSAGSEILFVLLSCFLFPFQV
jgi:hypothetical protein